MWPDVNDKKIEIEFTDASFLRRTLKIKEDEMQSLSNITKDKDSIYNDSSNSVSWSDGGSMY